MIKNVFIVGIEGNMGRRYDAVCKSLGMNVAGIDRKPPKQEFKFSRVDGFIIATPTYRHLQDIIHYSKFDKPILCEKPFATSVEQLQTLAEKRKQILPSLTMVNQYKYLCEESDEGDTIYDYFKTGSDGLGWDCINIVGLSKSTPTLDNRSPVWFCKINGRTLNIADMDKAYIAMIKDWANDPRSNWSYAVEAHMKAQACQRSL